MNYAPGRQVVNGLKNGLRTLPYVGGKSNFGGPGAWIASILETVKCTTYVEPSCGTLGVLLRRDPVQVEICNDACGRVINFFRIVRDQPDEFCNALMLTAHRSQAEFEWAKENLDNSDQIKAALACFVVLKNSIPASLIERSYYTDKGSWGHWRLPDDVYRLAARLNSVRFVCGDALSILERTLCRKDTLIYIDPPYPNSLGYCHSVDNAKMLELLSDTGRNAAVAVSGFVNSWPALEDVGYYRHDRRIHLQMDTAKRGRRVESLYTSWTPDA